METRHSPDYVSCECGSSWFRLEGRPGDPDFLKHGAVTIDGTGRITGYAGAIVCIECEQTRTEAAELATIHNLVM